MTTRRGGIAGHTSPRPHRESRDAGLCPEVDEEQTSPPCQAAWRLTGCAYLDRSNRALAMCGDAISGGEDVISGAGNDL
jgi:hypothetical protein